jgi:hypothetical protein
MKRLVLLIQPLPIRQASTKNAVRALLRTHGVAFWQYVPHAWLIADPMNRSAKWWRDALQPVVRTGRILVTNMDGPGWAASGVSKGYDWLHRNWSKRSAAETSEEEEP